MQKASLVMASGANFRILGPQDVMLKTDKPSIAVCAVRTGCGKSQTSRFIAEYLSDKELRVGILRHPMHYGNLVKQAVQKFASYNDLINHKCSIEEIEEYEPFIAQGNVIWAGVDYEKILEKAEMESDVILWDGGNNDIPFVKSDLHIVVTDPFRAGHELLYHPGTTNFIMADVVIINKVDTASPDNVGIIEENIKKLNPNAAILYAESPVILDNPDAVKSKRVLVVEDGPTLTRGGMSIGAGFVAAKKSDANIVDAKKYAVGSLISIFSEFPQLADSPVLPAMGYGEQQLRDLTATINEANCDIVIAGTPIDLARHLPDVHKPIVRARYSFKQIRGADIGSLVSKILLK